MWRTIEIDQDPEILILFGGTLPKEILESINIFDNWFLEVENEEEVEKLTGTSCERILYYRCMMGDYINESVPDEMFEIIENFLDRDISLDSDDDEVVTTTLRKSYAKYLGVEKHEN